MFFLYIFLVRFLCILNKFIISYSAKDFGVFLSDEDPRKGVWLESGRALEYYLLRNGVCFCITRIKGNFNF